MAETPKGQSKSGNRAVNKRAPASKGGSSKRSAATPQANQRSMRKAPRAENVSVNHGAEIVAALVVQSHRTSRLKTRLLIGLFIVLTASLAWNSVQNWTRPEPKLLGMTSDGRIQKLPLLDKPLASRQVLIDWVRRYIPTMYNFNYANYRGELNKGLKFMKPVTLDSFRKMLEKSGIMNRVVSDFLILQGRIVDEPLVQNEFVAKGTRVWVVEIPMKLIYDAGEKERGHRERINQDILFRAYIARANPLDYPGGLLLAKFDVSPRKGSQ